MLMYDPLEYSENYIMAPESLRNYYRDEVNDDTNENNAAGNYKINNNKTTSKSFGYQTKIKGGAPANNNTIDKKVAVSL